ncbi:type IV pilus biogenesis protein PilN [Yersinia rohdei]|uniref:Type IV pilus biogenesis protein PilN n=1 Tax=Yersinia rohdei TaxID=29485 RepID=A0A0U1HQD7_YERRO|nr:PilN domain-containing protein [Yersinia rohdei]CNF11583.1 type IV pilus biogenesis protein PilN [Yersinia rohdei]CNI66742.1 type IV pilus biogenesis protein PilN [Yersinia rohdei]CQI88753.1 type IV pilus biogenesis protein PilN [Yersinia rohdei]
MYQVNFSLWRTERQLARYRFWRNIGLCQCVVFVLVLWAILAQSHRMNINQQGRLAALLQQQIALSQQQQKVQQTMAQLQHAEQRLQVYRLAHQPARRYSSLLRLLSQQIPQSCWLVSIIPQGDTLVFSAFCQDYAAIDDFLIMLSRLSLLTNVILQRITQDEGHFRFVVHAGWQDEGNNNDE